MAYLETRKKNGREYFYAAKTFRTEKNRWKKVRVYCGDKKPGDEEFKRIAAELAEEARKKGIGREKRKHLLDSMTAAVEEIRRPLGEDTPKRTEDGFLAEFAYNSNAIAGSKLSLEDTKKVLFDHLAPADASIKDLNIALNTRSCLEFMKRHDRGLGKKLVFRTHGELMKNTGSETGYRKKEARIMDSSWAPPKPEDIQAEMKKVFAWWRNNEKKTHPVELAGILHNKIARVHPFTDGNGRLARVLLNWALIRKNYPPVYIENSEKLEYCWAIEVGDRGDDSKFIEYLANVMIKQHRGAG